VATEFADNDRPWIRDAFSRATLAAVTGLDSTSGTRFDREVDLRWLYQMFGVAGPAGTVPVQPVETEWFEDNFASVANGWRAGAGLTRLEKRRDALVLEAQRGSGSAVRDVHWSLPHGGTLVLEVAGRDLSDARVEVLGRGPAISRTFAVHGEIATARFVTVELPPGTYEGLRLQLTPIPGRTRIDAATGLTVLGGGRLDLRTVRLFPMVSGDPARSGGM